MDNRGLDGTPRLENGIEAQGDGGNGDSGSTLVEKGKGRPVSPVLEDAVETERIFNPTADDFGIQDFAARHPHLKGVDMVEQILDHLNVRCELADRDREQIPPRGPAIIVANHPLGALDGLALLLAVVGRTSPLYIVLGLRLL